MKKALLFILLSSCTSGIGDNKILVPKPTINPVIPQFKSLDQAPTIVNDMACFNRSDIDALLYNAKMARIYYNQQTMNLQLTQEYYSKVILQLGGIEQLEEKENKKASL
jgi:hypothetical protein